jgi:hypothetical protein
MFTAVSLRQLSQYGKMHAYEIRRRHKIAGPDGGLSMRRTSWLWLFLLLMCLLPLSPALGETASYSFPEEGLRLYLPGEWQVLTTYNLKDHEQEIKTLGTTMEALPRNTAKSGRSPLHAPWANPPDPAIFNRKSSLCSAVIK